MINRILRITGKPTIENQKINKIHNSKQYHIRAIPITIIRKGFEILVNE